MLRLIARSGASTSVPGLGPRPYSDPQFSKCQLTAAGRFKSRRGGPTRLHIRHTSGSQSLTTDTAQRKESIGHITAIKGRKSNRKRWQGAIAGTIAQDAEGGPLDNHRHVIPIRDRTTGPTSISSAELVHRRREELFAALDSGNATRLLTAAVEAFQHADIIASISPATVHEIFRSLDLETVVTRYHKISQQLRPGAIHMAIKAGSPARQVSDALDSFQDSFAKLVRYWQENGQTVGAPIFKTLLRLSALLGDGDTARTLRTMMKSLGHELDVESTNSYIRALCWNKVYGYNYPLTRVVAQKQRNATGLRTPEYALFIKNEVLEAFHEMTEGGYAANAETHSLLAVAMGRTGDLDGVANILKEIWDVDISEIKSSNMETSAITNDLQPGDILYPNQEVLFNLAHIYGTNNRFSDALLLVDHIARRYTIHIPLKIWEELTLRAFVLSTPRSLNAEQPWKREREAAFNEGHVSPKTMQRLWKTMTSAPYKVSPSLSMWDWRLRCMYRLRQKPHIWMALFESLVHQFKLYQASWPLPSASLAASHPGSVESGTARSIEDELALFDELIRADFAYKWIRHHLVVKHMITNPHWLVYKQIPTVIRRYLKIWFQCTRRALRYSTLTGRLNFHPEMLQPHLQIYEVYRSGSLRIARPVQKPLHLPFVEMTPSQRAVDLLRRRGVVDAEKWRQEWFEHGIQDWIWFPDGTGKLIDGGKADKASSRYIPSLEAFDDLTQHQRESLKARVEAQRKSGEEATQRTAYDDTLTYE